MDNEQTNNPLAQERIGVLMRRFALPAIISMLVSSLYNMVDQVFIGQGVGMLGNEATNIAFPVSILCTATALLLGIGSASNFNLRSGEGKDEEARSIAACGLSMLIICGVVIMAVILLFLEPLLYLFGSTEEVLPYAADYVGITAIGIPFLILTTGGGHLIRADRSPSYSMACMLSGAILNTILDPIFIFACGWGIKGAAWATVLGQIVSGVMVLFYFKKLSHMRFTRAMFLPRPARLKAILSLGMASCITQISLAVVQIAMNNILRIYGADSVYGADIPIACAGVITKVNQVFMAICIGISQGSQPIFGFNYGAKAFERVREAYRLAFKACLIIGLVFFLAFQIIPRPIISIFGSGTEEYYHFAERYFRIYMMLTLVNGIQPMSSGFFTSIGKAQIGMTVSLTRQILFLLPLIIIFPIFLGVDGVMYAGPIADGVAFFITVLFVRREMRLMKKEKVQLES